MGDHDSHLAATRLRLHRDRLQRNLPASAPILCRQVAWSLRARLPFLLSTADWEIRLYQHVRLVLQQQRVSAGNIDKMALLVLMQCVEDITIHDIDTPPGFGAKKDLDNAKDAVKNKLDSLSEMGEMESLRLQMAMDRLSKLMSTLSNLLKKASETAAGITQNIK